MGKMAFEHHAASDAAEKGAGRQPQLNQAAEHKENNEKEEHAEKELTLARMFRTDLRQTKIATCVASIPSRSMLKPLSQFRHAATTWHGQGGTRRQQRRRTATQGAPSEVPICRRSEETKTARRNRRTRRKRRRGDRPVQLYLILPKLVG